MKRLAFATPDSTMYWMNNNLEGRISAFFKDRQSWENIPATWSDIPRPQFDDYQRLDHGYDESLMTSNWTWQQCNKAAEFRGGQCLSEAMVQVRYTRNCSGSAGAATNST